MSLKCKIELYNYLTKIETKLSHFGLTLSIEADFHEYHKMRSDQLGREELAPMFDIKKMIINDGDGAWLKCVDDTGLVVHSQAFRILDLQHSNVREHIISSRYIYAPVKLLGEENLEVLISETLQKLSGVAAYHGEAWNHNKLRSSEASILLGRYGIMAAKHLFKTDFSFAFMTSRSLFSELHTRGGFSGKTPCYWSAGDENIENEWLIWLEGEELNEIVKTPVEQLTIRKSVATAA